jgi:hypothetical protein
LLQLLLGGGRDFAASEARLWLSFNRAFNDELRLLLGKCVVTTVSVQHVGDWVADFELWSGVGHGIPRHRLSVAASQVAPRARFGEHFDLEVVFDLWFVKSSHLKFFQGHVSIHVDGRRPRRITLLARNQQRWRCVQGVARTTDA